MMIRVEVMMVMTERMLLSPFFGKITIIIDSSHLRSIVSQETTLMGTLYTLCLIFNNPYVLAGKMEDQTG